MTYRDTHESLKVLYVVAATQGGYYAAKQAAAAGYDYLHLLYHLQAGNFESARSAGNAASINSNGGLVPAWSQEPTGGQTIARAETVATKASFRAAFKQR